LNVSRIRKGFGGDHTFQPVLFKFPPAGIL